MLKTSLGFMIYDRNGSARRSTTCHMPKYDVAEIHAKFTDHFIRVVKDGEPHPN